MKTIKKTTIVCTVMCLLLLLAISASALGLQQVTESSGLYNTIQAGFKESTAGTGSYGTVKNKIVKQCYVRLQEGSYDSGKVYSAVGVKTGGKRYIWTEELSKINNPFKTCYTNYGWLYY